MKQYEPPPVNVLVLRELASGRAPLLALLDSCEQADNHMFYPARRRATDNDLTLCMCVHNAVAHACATTAILNCQKGSKNSCHRYQIVNVARANTDTARTLTPHYTVPCRNLHSLDSPCKMLFDNACSPASLKRLT